MSGHISKRERVAMPQLCWDCMQLGFDEKESLIFINSRLGRDTTGTVKGKGRGITAGTYYYYKRQVTSGEYTNDWLSDFTRVGYVVSHHKLIKTAEEQYHDIVKRLWIEENKTIADPISGLRKEARDEYKIMRLRADLREQGKYIAQLNDTTPIVAQVRRVLLENENAKSITQHGKTDDKQQQSVVESRVPPVE